MIYDVFKAWEAARAFILPALAFHPTHSEDDVLVRLVSREYKLWQNDTAALITCFLQYPQFEALEVRWGGGDLAGLAKLKPQVERFALANGCRETVSTGRDGWGRVYPDYRRCGAIYFKEM